MLVIVDCTYFNKTFGSTVIHPRIIRPRIIRPGYNSPQDNSSLEKLPRIICKKHWFDETMNMHAQIKNLCNSSFCKIERIYLENSWTNLALSGLSMLSSRLDCNNGLVCGLPDATTVKSVLSCACSSHRRFRMII
jgi:hypothetical protein